MGIFHDLSGKKVLIIGASSGIGRQAAIQLSKQGAKLFLVARREEKLQNVWKELEGEGHLHVTADMNDVYGIEALFEYIKRHFGALDGMVYTAGMTATMPVSMLKPEKLNQVMTVHFFSFVECVRQICKKGRFNEGARIVAMSSIAAKCGDKGHTAYSSAKAAIEGAVRCRAMELAAKKIYLNAVAPGMTKTEMLADFLKNNGEESPAYKKIVSRQYLGIGNPEDIANVILFLLSQSSGFITGAIIPVDGGYTAC